MRTSLVIFALLLAPSAGADEARRVAVLPACVDGHPSQTQEHVDPAAAERLFQTLFFRHLQHREECPTTVLAGRRGDAPTGDIVPSIVSVLHGAFTAPKLKETLYVISVGECGTPDELGSYRIVIARDHDEKVAFVAPYAGTAATNVVNVDGDGIDEWVSISSSCVRGVCTESAAVMRASGLKLTTVKDLGTVYYSSCCAVFDDKTVGQVFCSSVTLRDGHYVKVTDSRICSCL
jgi:hypothetical protein